MFSPDISRRNVPNPSAKVHITGYSVTSTTDWKRGTMSKELFKCFACGKLYDDEKSALACHNAPIQKVLKTDQGSKPRFLGN